MDFKAPSTGARRDAAIAVAVLAQRDREVERSTRLAHRAHPRGTAIRLEGRGAPRRVAQADGVSGRARAHTHRIEVLSAGDSTLTVEIDGVARTVDSRRIGHTTYSLLIDGRSVVAEVSVDGDEFTVSDRRGDLPRPRLSMSAAPAGDPGRTRGRDRAATRSARLMPGKVVDVWCKSATRWCAIKASSSSKP